VAVVIPLNNFLGPADDTVTAQTYYRIQNTELSSLLAEKIQSNSVSSAKNAKTSCLKYVGGLEQPSGACLLVEFERCVQEWNVEAYAVESTQRRSRVKSVYKVFS
jgi:hypothetical protein